MDISTRDDMGGMDMSPTSTSKTNQDYAQDYWYFIAAVVGLFLVIRVVNFIQNWSRYVNPVGHG